MNPQGSQRRHSRGFGESAVTPHTYIRGFPEPQHLRGSANDFQRRSNFEVYQVVSAVICINNQAGIRQRSAQMPDGIPSQLLQQRHESSKTVGDGNLCRLQNQKRNPLRFVCSPLLWSRSQWRSQTVAPGSSPSRSHPTSIFEQTPPSP